MKIKRLIAGLMVCALATGLVQTDAFHLLKNLPCKECRRYQ